MLHLLLGCSRPGWQLVTAYSALLMRLVCGGTSLLVEHLANGMLLQDSFTWWQSQWAGADALPSWPA